MLVPMFAIVRSKMRLAAKSALWTGPFPGFRNGVWAGILLGLGIAMVAAAQPGPEDPRELDESFPRVSVVVTNWIDQVTGDVRRVFRFQRSGDEAPPLTVRYLVSSDGTNGVDFERLSGKVRFDPGAWTADVVVKPRSNGVPASLHSVSLQVLPEAHPFSLTVLPDTQYYVFPKHGGAVEMFRKQLEWIVQQKDTRQMEYVLHLGDITELNTPAEWMRARGLFALLDGVVPYALAFGNHDGLYDQGNRTEPGNLVFKTADFAAWPTYGGVFESNRMENMYHLFTAGGIDWLLLSLEYGPRDVVLDWANAVVPNHPDRKVIVITHAHVYWNNTYQGSATNHVGIPSLHHKRQNDPAAVWDKFLRRHANIAMVLNGHASAPGHTAGQIIGSGDHGNRVYQFLSDYQFDGNGGGGFLRVLNFKPQTDGFEISTYSPFFDRYLTNGSQSFAFSNTGIFAGSRTNYLPTPSPGNSATLSVVDPDTELADPVTVGAAVYGEPPKVFVRFDRPADRNWVTDVTRYRFGSGRVVADVRRRPGSFEVELQTEPALTLQEVDSLTVLGEASSPTITLTNTGALLVADFLVANLTDWKSEQAALITVPPVWRIADQRLYEFTGGFSPGFSANDNRRGPMLVWNGAEARDWTDYSVAATFLPGQPMGMGLVFRYRDTNNFYKVEVDLTRRFHKLTRRQNGVETLLAQAGSFNWETNNLDFVTPKRLRVELVGEAIEAFYDGNPMFGGPIADPALGSGSVGIYGWANRGLSVDDLVVAPPGSVAPSVRFLSPPPELTNLPDNALNVSLAVEPGPAPVTLVQLYDGSQLLASLSSPPFAWNWTNITAGAHLLSAAVTDAAGNRVLTSVRQLWSPVLMPQPVFVRQPRNASETEGHRVTFYGRAVPRGLAYQWYFNGEALANETNKWLVLPALTPEQAGTYHLRATNELKSASSLPATLTVFPDAPPGLQEESSADTRLELWDLDPDGWVVGWIAGEPKGRWRVEETVDLALWEFVGAVTNRTGTSWFVLPTGTTNQLMLLRGRLDPGE